MKQPILVASAKPNEHKVHVKNKTYVYSRIRKMEMNDDKCYVRLMSQVAKITLRVVKEIVLKQRPKRVDWREEFQRNKKWITINGRVTWR